MYIDLSVPLNEDTPVYPGDPSVKIKPVGVFANDGYNDHLISIGTHVGTHIDAPYHMLGDGKQLNEFPVDKFIGQGVLVDVRDGYDLEMFKRQNISEKSTVLLYTGLSERYHEADYFEKYEQIPENVAQYLVERKVKMVGMDMCGPDHEPFEIHKILLGGEVLIIENLTNLEKLVGKKFKVIALPLNLQIDGSPARVIAEIEE